MILAAYIMSHNLSLLNHQFNQKWFLSSLMNHHKLVHHKDMNVAMILQIEEVKIEEGEQLSQRLIQMVDRMFKGRFVNGVEVIEDEGFSQF